MDYELQNPVLKPIIIAQTTIKNDTEAAGEQTFTDTKTTTDTTTRTTQNAVKFGIKIETKLDYFFAGGSVAGSFETTFTDTKTQTDTKTRTWGWNVKLPVPKRSRVEASVIVQEGTYGAKYEGEVEFSGIAMLEDVGPGKEHRWGYDLGLLFTKYPDDNVKVLDDKTIRVHVDGEFKVISGLSYSVEAKQYSIDSNDMTGLYGTSIRSESLIDISTFRPLR
ncbi:ETX/MTX2 family pore-forming toxin [Methylobacterium sp. Leaf86]|uniref:ETX/MTX2 family pore-forming toxin n=1 Tax=Methylobacterium sp. Leaf86 TaxID=1736242 RepID=UPI00138F183B|nr:ETX/MTX2 family pore-forming toxin [Methylobacterium sp. Leaf86]